MLNLGSTEARCSGNLIIILSRLDSDLAKYGIIAKASSKYSDGLETILNVIETLTTNVRRYKIIEDMHESPFIRDVLRNFYFDLIDFCARCVKYYSRPKISESHIFFSDLKGLYMQSHSNTHILLCISSQRYSSSL